MKDDIIIVTCFEMLLFMGFDKLGYFNVGVADVIVLIGATLLCSIVRRNR